MAQLRVRHSLVVARCLLRCSSPRISGDRVDVELRRVGDATSLEEIFEPPPNATPPEGRYVFELPEEHALTSTRLEIEVDPDDEIDQTYDGSSDITFSLGVEEILESEIFKLVFVPIEVDGEGPTVKKPLKTKWTI